MILPALFALTLAQSSLHPPFRKVWNAKLSPNGDPGGYVEIADGMAFVGGLNLCQRVDLRSHRPVWTAKLPGRANSFDVKFHDGVLYVRSEPVAGAAPKPALRAMSPTTGKTLWQVAISEKGGDIAFGKGFACLEAPFGNLVGIDLATHRVRWRRPILVGGKVQGEGLTGLLVAGSAVVGTTWNGAVLAYGVRDGRPAWHWQDGGRRWWLLDANDRMAVVESATGPLTALSPQTGKPIWTAPGVTNVNSARLEGGTILAATHDRRLVKLAAADGRILGTARVDQAIVSDLRQAPRAEGLLLARGGGKIYAIRAGGSVAWSWPVEDEGVPIGARGATFYLADRNIRDGEDNQSSPSIALYAFAPGTPSSLPTGDAARRALAQRLVRGYSRLSVDQKRDLEKLGHVAIDAEIDGFVQASQREAKSESDDAKAGAGQDDFDECSMLGRLIFENAQAGDTDKLIAAIAQTPSPWWRGPLVQTLALKGDMAKATPVFIERLEKAAPEDWDNTLHDVFAAIRGLAGSNDPRAVDYLLKKLNDPTARTEIREAAYWNLAATGGERGVRAVLALRDSGRTVPADFETRMELASIPETPAKNPRRPEPLVATHRQPDGTLYGLVESPVLGSFYDLWLVRWEDGRWRHPLFTGVTARPPQRPSKRRNPDEKASAAETRALLDGGWISKFIGNPALEKDSDGDGLTDLEEARLGTDPNRTDTDGDGIPDARDANPLVAPRPLTEDERVIQAAFEARYHFHDHRDLPMSVSIEGHAPMELYGSGGYVLPTEKDRFATLFGLGPAFVRIQLDPKPDPHGDRVVHISTTYARVNGAGYVLTLRRIGDDWIVVSGQMEWIS